MLHRLLFFALLAGLVGLALWDIARRNPGLFPRARQPQPRPRPRLARTPAPQQSAPSRSGQVLAFERPPHEVLGVESDASLKVVEAAYRRLREEVAPERLDGMSEELRALAQRRTEELDKAVAALRRRLG